MTSSVTEAIKQRYGAIANQINEGTKGCGTSCCKSGSGTDPITKDLYVGSDHTSDLPKNAITASLGCGNPTAMVKILPGQTVLDLGSGTTSLLGPNDFLRRTVPKLNVGGGIDCLISARKVGVSGKVYGLDMTEDMILLARNNAEEAGVTNVEYLLGRLESIPLPAESVDVIISNCVINLASDKDLVLREAYRVLRKGGKVAISDIVLKRALPEGVRVSMEMWTGCVSGALLEDEYVKKLYQAGFCEASIEEVRVYTDSDV